MAGVGVSASFPGATGLMHGQYLWMAPQTRFLASRMLVDVTSESVWNGAAIQFNKAQMAMNSDLPLEPQPAKPTNLL